MALIKKTDKDESENKLSADQAEAAVKKKDSGKKPMLKPDAKKAAPVKKETANAIARFKGYIRGVYSELKKVHWPTRREVLVYTGVVALAVVIVGALIWVFDSLMSRLLQLIIR